MKAKQLESIQKQHNRYINNGVIPEPKVGKHIPMALVKGEPLKLKSQAQIIDICRQKLIEERYSSRNIDIEELFASCATFDAAMKEYTAKVKAREKRVEAYKAVADPLIRRAELDDDADALEISEKLAEAAKEHGLYQ